MPRGLPRFLTALAQGLDYGVTARCFPTVTHIINFETALRTGDLIDESIRRAGVAIYRPSD